MSGANWKDTIETQALNEADAKKSPEERERAKINDANRQKVEDDENEKKRNINNIFAKSQIEALNELKQDQSLKSALQILVKNFTFILKDTKGGQKGIIFAGPNGTNTRDDYYDSISKSFQNYASEFITYSSILNNTKDLYNKQINRPKGIFSKSSSVAIHTSTTDELQKRINEMKANETIYTSVSNKFLELWKQRFKENMAAAQYDESERTDEKFNSLLKTKVLWHFLSNGASAPDYLFNLVIMYLFPIELKYAPIPLVYGLNGTNGVRNCDECVKMLDGNYLKAMNESAYRSDKALKFKESPNSAVGGRRTKRMKQKRGKTNKMMRMKQNTKTNKRRRTHRRR
jgi:hypothetical protein